jgi:hypothetical protein
LALAEPQEGAAKGSFAALGSVKRRTSASSAAREGPCVITTSRGVRELGPFMSRDSHAVGVVFAIEGDRVAGAARRRGGVVTIPVNTRGFGAAWSAMTAPSRRKATVSR